MNKEMLIEEIERHHNVSIIKSDCSPTGLQYNHNGYDAENGWQYVTEEMIRGLNE